MWYPWVLFLSSVPQTSSWRSHTAGNTHRYKQNEAYQKPFAPAKGPGKWQPGKHRKLSDNNFLLQGITAEKLWTQPYSCQHSPSGGAWTNEAPVHPPGMVIGNRIGSRDLHPYWPVISPPPVCVSGNHLGNLDFHNEVALTFPAGWCQRRPSGESGLSLSPSSREATVTMVSMGPWKEPELALLPNSKKDYPTFSCQWRPSREPRFLTSPAVIF